MSRSPLYHRAINKLRHNIKNIGFFFQNLSIVSHKFGKFCLYTRIRADQVIIDVDWWRALLMRITSWEYNSLSDW